MQSENAVAKTVKIPIKCIDRFKTVCCFRRRVCVNGVAEGVVTVCVSVHCLQLVKVMHPHVAVDSFRLAFFICNGEFFSFGVVVACPLLIRVVAEDDVVRIGRFYVKYL